MNPTTQNPQTPPQTSPTDTHWEQVRTYISSLKREMAQNIVGQDAIVEQMLAALLCRGHCLIIGVPGLGKTLLVRTLGNILGLSFSRIQFTPDLMPSDILGSEILQTEQGSRTFTFAKGPIFHHLILADEINRTPPKTQSALLEAMQEKQVTVAGQTWHLEEPFAVYATQNPIEHEGTYPLPEAQLDRFFFSLVIDYPTFDEEKGIVLRTMTPPASSTSDTPQHQLTRQRVLELQALVPQVPLPDHVLDYAVRLVHATRPVSPHADEFVKKYVAWGAGPRASQCITLAAKANALLRGEGITSTDDVRSAALPVLRHRVIPNYNAVGEGISSEQIINHLLEKIR